MSSPEPAPPPVSPYYQDPLETWTAKFARKFKENPWVPIGCVATCGALIMSAVKLRQGQSKQMNYWLRARVGLQGATVVALLMGTTWGREFIKEHFGDKEAIAVAEEEAKRAKEAQRERERQEFEERLRAAQLATEQEETFGVSGGKRVVGGTTTTTAETGKSEVVEAAKKSNGWRLWRTSSSQEKDDSSKS
ncbi:hypothetical protein CVT26_000938 [Gymnopilus dilepis]|uniref:HIG1 domain-containing protein n=1 Tax=Gymnopilus dilepis TaxID=231916 RepID=A0A409W780_9AGAR|nr:hypothetical protein CVT26_000938 [Gymnopilus dilepis]